MSGDTIPKSDINCKTCGKKLSNYEIFTHHFEGECSACYTKKLKPIEIKDSGSLTPTIAREEQKKKMPRVPKGKALKADDSSHNTVFSSLGNGEQVAVKYLPLESRTGEEMYYTGIRLSLEDENLFLLCLELNQNIKAGEIIYVRRSKLLEALDKCDSGENYTWLNDVFDRLASATITFKSKRRHYTTGLVQEYEHDLREADFYFRLATSVWKHYEKYTLINLSVRKKLKPLGKWLYSYFSSNSGLQKVTFETIYRLCGAREIFKNWTYKRLKPALKDLEQLGAIKNLKIEKKLITCERVQKSVQNKSPKLLN